jgi:hypothetical protein
MPKLSQSAQRAVSSLGGFRTPAPGVRGAVCGGPASENLHKTRIRRCRAYVSFRRVRTFRPARAIFGAHLRLRRCLPRQKGAQAGQPPATCRHEPRECRARPGPLQWPALTAEQEMCIARQPVQLGNSQPCPMCRGGFSRAVTGNFLDGIDKAVNLNQSVSAPHQRIIKARNHKPWQEGGRQNSEPGTKVFSWGTRMRSRQIR